MADWAPAGAPVPLTPTERWKAISTPVPTYMTPEQHFEHFMGRQPRLVRALGPSTIGEAGYAGGSALAGVGAALAPETFGSSLVLTLPLLAAVAGGAIEDPKHPFSGGLYEGGKAALTEAGGRLATKGVELAGRFASKVPMLERSFQRIAAVIPQLFSEYPLPKAPKTVEELREHLGGGKVAIAAGQKLGAMRDTIKSKFANEFVYLPDIDSGGNLISRQFSVADGIDHVRELFAGGRTAAGAQKNIASAVKTLDAAQSAQGILASKLDQLQTGLGQQYVLKSHDYAVAKQLEKVFVSPSRETHAAGGLKAVIDQPSLKAKAEKVAPKLEQIRPGAGTKLTRGIAPTGAAAKEEIPFGPHVHGGAEGFRAYMRPPVPFNPETRAMLPFVARILSDPKLSRLYGYAAQRGIEEQE